jgi:O-antigen/teichoic acid export membrane protein
VAFFPRCSSAIGGGWIDRALPPVTEPSTKVASTAASGYASLLAKIGEAFFLQVLGAGLLFLMHTLVAKVTGAAQYGIFAYAYAISSAMAVVASLGFGNSSMRFVAEYREQRDWARLRGLLTRAPQLVAAASLAGAIALVLAARVAPAADLASSLSLAALLLLPVALGFWRSLAIRGLQRVRESIVPEEVLRPGLMVAICFLLLMWGRSQPASTMIWTYFGAAMIALFLGVVWLWRWWPREAKDTPPRFETKFWIATSFPMWGAAVLQEVMMRADVLMLGWLAGMETTGLYSAAGRIAALNVFALKVVDTVVAPRIAAAHYGRRPQELRLVLKRGTVMSAAGALPLFVIMMLWPAQLLALFGAEFVQATPYLRILALGQLVSAATGPVGYALLMTGHQRAYAKVLALCTLATVAASAVAIPRYGALGAAWVTCAAVIALNLALWWEVRKALSAGKRD